MYFRSDGVILSSRNFGEADKILRIFTKDHGKISVLAKGVRRPKSKKGGHVEIGNWCKIFVANGKSLDLLTEVELKKAFGHENLTYEKNAKIFHILELVDMLSQEHQKNFTVYKLLVQYLDKINKVNNFNLISSIFKVKLLSNLGFFSAKTLNAKNAKKVITILEDDDFEKIEAKVKLDKPSYLKLLKFLDSMIETIADKQFKTARFLK